MSARFKALNLYKRLMRESQKFPSYNYRHYAIRKTRHEFRENQNVNDPKKLEELFKKAQDNLEIIQRQVLIGQMYDSGHLVIEDQSKNK